MFNYFYCCIIGMSFNLYGKTGNYISYPNIIWFSLWYFVKHLIEMDLEIYMKGLNNDYDGILVVDEGHTKQIEVALEIYIYTYNDDAFMRYGKKVDFEDIKSLHNFVKQSGGFIIC